jgi:hypothetical protein
VATADTADSPDALTGGHRRAEGRQAGRGRWRRGPVPGRLQRDVHRMGEHPRVGDLIAVREHLSHAVSPHRSPEESGVRG